MFCCYHDFVMGSCWLTNNYEYGADDPNSFEPAELNVVKYCGD
jgi:hypothetical protein